MEKLLMINNLRVENIGTLILKDIFLELNEGEILGIIGESGSGKSTLIRAVIGMPGSKEKIVQGEVIFDEKDLVSICQEEFYNIRGSKMGIVFQNPASTLNPTKKIGKQFIEVIRSHEKIKKKDCIERSLDILEKLNLKDGRCILDSYPFEMSGGMNQRIAIALSMILKPKILITDEPTSALDSAVQSQVIDEMVSIKENLNTSIVIVTHSMDVISKIADRVAVMYNGEIVEYGKKEDILNNPVHPYTKALIASVPKINGKTPIGIKGNPPYFDNSLEGCSFYDRCSVSKISCSKYNQNLKGYKKGHYVRCNVIEK
ncbi:MAG TPA: ABC transporter ATP-binding protein [Clostridium sp.]|nr:ABC transporter ATP-binding protein [Clostridium sp.]